MRKVALGLIRRNGKFLVEKFYDDVGKVYFYKLIGGGVEADEKPEDALRREFLEEMKTETRIISAFDPVEEDFVYKGTKRLIKAYVFEAEFVNPDDYDFIQKFIYSPEGKFLSVAMWKSLQEIASEKLDFYPRPIIEKIKKCKR